MDAVSRQRSRERKKSAGQAFGDTHEIWRDPSALASKHSPGPAKASQDFVGDEQHIVGGGEVADAREKLFGMNDHAARALKQRLHDDGGNFVAAFGKHAFEFFQTFNVASRAFEVHRAMRAGSRVRPQDRQAKRVKCRGKGRIVADRHRAGRIAVISVLERDDPAFFGAT